MMLSENGIWEYKINGAYGEIIGYRGTETDITVPSYIDGIEIKKIGKWAFSRSDSILIEQIKRFILSITSVTISEGIEEIGNWAFLSLRGLERVTLPESLRVVGCRAFDGCESLKEIVIYGNTEKICEGAFAGCASLEYAEIKEGVTEISDCMFCGCESLRKISLPKTVRKIGTDAFYGCYLLDGITLPKEVTLCDGAFTDCYALPFTEYKNGKYFGSKENPHLVLFSVIDKSVTSFEIHENTEIISVSAFENCAVLSVKMPKGLRSVDSSAFSGCTSLAAVNLPKSLSFIGKSAFCGCAITSVKIPAGVGKIPEKAFGCVSLCSVTIDGVCDISPDAFSGCKIKYIDAPNMAPPDFIPAYRPLAACGYMKSFSEGRLTDGKISAAWDEYIKTEGQRLTASAKDMPFAAEYMTKRKLLSLSDTDRLLSEGDVSVECRAVLMDYREKGFTEEEKNSKFELEMGFRDFTEKELYDLWELESNGDGFAVKKYKGKATEAVVPDFVEGKPVTEILGSAFEKTAVTSVFIPDTVKKIGETAFEDCKALSSVRLSDGITSLGVGVFRGCVSLKGIKLPLNITRVPDSAFYGCSSLDGIKVPDGVTEVGHSAFAFCKTLKTVFIPEGVKKIVFDVFFGCPSLDEITLPESLETLYGLGTSASPSLKIKAKKNTFAEKYAINNGIPFTEV